jgi:hypothetical protein
MAGLMQGLYASIVGCMDKGKEQAPDLGESLPRSYVLY